MRKFIAAAGFLFALASSASASSLSVAPIRIDIPEPGNSGSVTIRNEDARATNVQIRVYKWSLADGDDSYEETEEVAATPPVAEIAAGGAVTVRILRSSGAAATEDAYRLVVDEIPDANRVKNIGVNVAVRYTIPVFFLNADASQPKLEWSLRQDGGKRILDAVNSGDKHIRLNGMSVGGAQLYKGLAGYVLGHSTRSWVLPSRAKATRVVSESDAGRIDATISQ